MKEASSTKGKTQGPAQVSVQSIVKCSLILFLPLAAVLASIFVMYYYPESKHRRTIIETEAFYVVKMQKEVIEEEMRSILSDLIHLSEEPELVKVLEKDEAGPREIVAEECLTFFSRKGIYDHIHLLDGNGMEVVRVDFNEGNPIIVPDNQLQNRLKHYYFEETLKLEKGEVFVSSFAQYTERGEIEQPPKPILRLGTPVSTGQGRKDGVVLVDCSLVDVMQSLDHHNNHRGLYRSMLFSSDGIWLKGLRAENERGLIDEEQSAGTFEQTFLEAWQRISRAESGQFYTANGMFTFVTVYPLLIDQKSSTRAGKTLAPSAKLNEAKDYYWKIISYTTPDAMNAVEHELSGKLLLVYAVTVVILAVCSWDLGKARARSRLAETNLRKNERYFRSLLFQIHENILVVDQNYRITDVNDTFLATSGYTREEVIGSHCYEVSHGYDGPCDTYGEDCMLRKAFETGESQNCRHEHKNRDGFSMWLDIRLSPLKDEEGYVTHVIESARDVTDVIDAREELKTSEDKMRLIIESSPIGILIDQDGYAIYVNPSLSKMFGYESPEEIIGLPVEVLYDSQEREAIMQERRDCLEGKSVLHHEARSVNKDGETFHVAVCMTPIDYQGEPAILNFVSDISTERTLRAQLLYAQKMEAVGTLAGGVAHDFNNLLHIIHGHSWMLLRSKVQDDPSYQALQIILRTADRGSELSRQLLTFSRKVESKMRPIILNQEVINVAKLLQRTIPKMVEVEFHLAGAPKVVNADPGQVEQVLINLTVNAKDAMPDGGKLVFKTENVALDEEYCKTHLGAKPGEYVLLAVTDTGRGMDKETLEHIFEPFYTTKEVGEGTGLGLAMVYGIVKSHDGYITCNSRPGEGTTFEIYLPVMEQEAEAVDVSEVEAPLEGNNETILLVDDEEDIRELGEELLTEFDYTVLTAVDGESALELYKKEHERVDLIILDMIMPGMGGIKCLDELLRINPQAKVLGVSGYLAIMRGKDTVEDRVKAFISKPYHGEQMLKVVREILDELPDHRD